MIGSLLFNLCYVLWTALVGIIFFPVIFFPKQIILLVVGQIWARGLYCFLRLFCHLQLDLRGAKNIVKGPAIYASKHQSALETFMFHILLDKPIFILKQELLNIPIFGFYLKAMGMIAIDRQAGMKSLKKLLFEVKDRISHGYSIVIFPEGTRTVPGQTSQYNAGVVAIYNLQAAPLIPVALNTGCFWPKNSFIKKPGRFAIEFLPAVPQDLNKQECMELLQESIEKASKDLLS